MERWIIPCNPKYYDVVGAFNKLKTLDWKQSNKNIAVGDIVYIYVSAPTSAIKYQCKVNKVLLETIEIDDTEFMIKGDVYADYPAHMELELLKEYDDEYTMVKLQENGMLGRLQGPRRIKGELADFID